MRIQKTVEYRYNKLNSFKYEGDAHFTVVLSEVDAKLLKKLGIRVSCQPKYETKKLYHK